MKAMICFLIGTWGAIAFSSPGFGDETLRRVVISEIGRTYIEVKNAFLKYEQNPKEIKVRWSTLKCLSGGEWEDGQPTGTCLVHVGDEKARALVSILVGPNVELSAHTIWFKKIATYKTESNPF